MITHFILIIDMINNIYRNYLKYLYKNFVYFWQQIEDIIVLQCESSIFRQF